MISSLQVPEAVIRRFNASDIFQAWIPRYDDGIILTGLFWFPYNEQKHVKKVA